MWRSVIEFLNPFNGKITDANYGGLKAFLDCVLMLVFGVMGYGALQLASVIVTLIRPPLNYTQFTAMSSGDFGAYISEAFLMMFIIGGYFLYLVGKAWWLSRASLFNYLDRKES